MNGAKCIMYFLENHNENQINSPLGGNGNLVEGDETFIGKRKYGRGKAQRTGGPQILQTLLEVHQKADGYNS